MASWTRAELFEKALACGIPVHMQESLVEYIITGRPVGHFLTAILSNDFMGAANRADDANAAALYGYARFLWNYAPVGCWGSADRVAGWRSHQGRQWTDDPDAAKDEDARRDERP